MLGPSLPAPQKSPLGCRRPPHGQGRRTEDVSPCAGLGLHWLARLCRGDAGIPNVIDGKARLREGRDLAKGQRKSKWEKWDSNPGLGFNTHHLPPCSEHSPRNRSPTSPHTVQTSLFNRPARHTLYYSHFTK